jgi:bifunctional polynucleotide phosphatase/kinase
MGTFDLSGTLIQTKSDKRFYSKVAAFDLDGTLIQTKSGKRFPRDSNDWKLFHPNVLKQLHELHADGYTLAIISNQLGIGKGKVNASEIQYKIDAIVKHIGLPMIAILATEDDHMRKPRIGSWEYLEELLSSTIDKNVSFYCGDAAGRPNDFAATDYQFALNVGLSFKTPEELFLGTPPSHVDRWAFDPRKLLEEPLQQTGALIPSKQEMVVLVGSPASGKSSLARWCCLEYVIICQDELGTIAKCKKACKEALYSGCSVIIDSTNRNAKTRAIWIELARTYQVSVKCVWIQVDKPLAMHINKYRTIYGHKKIPAIAIHCYYKAFEQPTVDEGFHQIIQYPFQLNRNQINELAIKRISSFM